MINNHSAYDLMPIDHCFSAVSNVFHTVKSHYETEPCISMSRPAQVVINLHALKENLAFARQISGRKVVGVVKANAYGHGALTIARVLESEHIDYLAVACIEEACELRHNGIQTSILLLEGFFSTDELPIIEQYNLSIVIHHQEQIDMLLAHPNQQPLDIWLKLNSGMNRIGFLSQDYLSAYQTLKESDKVRSIVFMTHFSCANDLDSDYTHQQLTLFQKTISELPGETSLCNSSGVLGWPQAHGDLIRPGLMLYGASPFNVTHPKADQLKPVMELSSELIAIHNLPTNVPIGYSAGYTTSRPTRSGVVAIGYADGYPRHTPNGAPVIINGQRTRIMGKVSMDMISIDLTEMPEAKIGDKVTLWGAELSATEVAQHAGTIPYELFCNTKRVEFSYIDTPSK
ncbi:MAG: alanine racemase [Endozoicomonadaceae bacterium]|nr:alanine racemase [Endozoicomonadaceae bacterium]